MYYSRSINQINFFSETKSRQRIYFGENTDDEFVIYSYKKCFWLRYLCYLLYILTGGILFLFLHWYSDWWIQFNAKKVPFSDSDIILVSQRNDH